MGLILATDLTSRLTRLNAELTRRNGYNSLAGYTQSFPSSEPVAVNNMAEVSAINVLFAGLRYINSTNVPVDRTALTSQMLASDLTTVDNLLTTFEAKARGSRSSSDCNSACSGTCVTQCTTTCTSCTGCSGSCDGCSDTCYGGCLTGCKSACALACATSCGGTCVSSCAKACNSNCTGGCKGGCYSSCDKGQGAV